MDTSKLTGNTMDTSRLTDYEYNCVVKFIRKQLDDPYLYTRMWVEGYRNLFDPNSYAPIQIVKFYALTGREIVEYNFTCDTKTISFSEFRNRISSECMNKHMELIGPRVSKDSSIKELVDIIKFYEDHHYIRFNEWFHEPSPGYQEDSPADHIKTKPTDKPVNQSRETISNLI